MLTLPARITARFSGALEIEWTHIHLKDVRAPDVLDWARKNDVTFNSAVKEGLFTVPGDGDR